MDELTPDQIATLRELLISRRGQLEELLRLGEDGVQPVDLDEPIGRVSRMDAIQQQSMVQANRAAARQRLAQVDGALRRMEEGEYGECLACGDEVGFARLEARPETPFCVACQSSREAPR